MDFDDIELLSTFFDQIELLSELWLYAIILWKFTKTVNVCQKVFNILLGQPVMPLYYGNLLKLFAKKFLTFYWDSL